MFSALSFLIFILACFGLTQVLVYGSIFDKIRPKNKFFHCTMCMGFWVGILVYILMALVGDKTSPTYLEHWRFWGEALVMGFVSSGTSYALSSIFGDDGINISHK